MKRSAPSPAKEDNDTDDDSEDDNKVRRLDDAGSVPKTTAESAPKPATSFPSFTGTAFPAPTSSLSFSFQKPLASLKKGGEGGNNGTFWEVRHTEKRTTVRQGAEGTMGQSETKDHETEAAAEAWAKAEADKMRADGYTDIPQCDSGGSLSADAPKPFAGLFGGITDQAATSPPKFEGLFKAFGGGAAGAEEEAKPASGSFKSFETPKFGSGGGFGGKLSFGGGAASAPPVPAGGGFSSMFGSFGATNTTSDKDEKKDESATASFGTAAAADPAADIAQALKEKAQEGEPAEVSPRVPHVATKAIAVDLPEQELKTGEEEEDRIYQAQNVKLYVFDSGKWKECGAGNLHVNKHGASGACRLVMRVANTHKLVLNARLWPDMMCQVLSDKELRISGPDLEGKMQMFSIRVLGGRREVAKQIENVILQNKGTS